MRGPALLRPPSSGGATSRPPSSAGSRGGSLARSGSAGAARATPAAIDAALERLYEEGAPEKLAGASAVWALARAAAANLQPLADHPTLLGALARSLRDDGRKSAELAASLLQTLCCFSLFSDFHALLTTHRVGDACLRLLELEVKRAAARALDGARLERLAALQAQGDARAEAEFRRQDEAALQRPLLVVNGGGAAAAGGGGSSRSSGSARSASPSSRAPPADGAAPPAGGGHLLKPLPPGRVDLDRERLRAGVLARRQDAVLALALRLLVHLAEDVQVERKMCSRGIVALLVPLLTLRLGGEGGAPATSAAAAAAAPAASTETTAPSIASPALSSPPSPCLDVPCLALHFLRKLSVFEENKDAMARAHIERVLVPLLAGATAAATSSSGGDGDAAAAVPPRRLDDAAAAAAAAVELRCSVLHLMFNLCFDRDVCAALVREGAVPRAAALLRQPVYRGAALQLLYHISQDGAHRPAFCGSGDASVPLLVLKLVVGFPAQRLPRELAGLAINLALCPTTAGCALERAAGSSGRAGADGGGLLRALVARAVRTRDPCVLRILRGLAWHSFALQCAAHDRAAAAEERAFVAAVRADRLRQRRAPPPPLAGVAAAVPAQQLESPGLPPGDTPDAGDVDDDAVDTGLLPDEPVAYSHRFAGLWAPHVREFARLAVAAAGGGDAGVLAEALGVLACLTQADLAPSGLAWGSYAREPAFLGALVGALECAPLPHDADDDVLLAALQVLCAAACDPDAAEALAGERAGLARALLQVLCERRSDADVLLQACCAIGRLLHHADTRAALLGDADGRLPCALVELVGHAHGAVAADAAGCMHLALEELAARLGADAPLVAQLRARRFALYNREWCQGVASDEARERAAAAVLAAPLQLHPRPSTASLGGGGPLSRPSTASGRRPSTASGGAGGSGGGGGGGCGGGGSSSMLQHVGGDPCMRPSSGRAATAASGGNPPASFTRQRPADATQPPPPPPQSFAGWLSAHPADGAAFSGVVQRGAPPPQHRNRLLLLGADEEERDEDEAEEEEEEEEEEDGEGCGSSTVGSGSTTGRREVQALMINFTFAEAASGTLRQQSSRRHTPAAPPPPPLPAASAAEAARFGL